MGNTKSMILVFSFNTETSETPTLHALAIFHGTRCLPVTSGRTTESSIPKAPP